MKGITELLEKRREELKKYKIDVWLLMKKEGDSEHLERELYETEGKIKMLDEILSKMSSETNEKRK